MAKKTSSNIHLKHNEAVYTFLNISIEDANDGSVYVSLMRQGNSDNSFIQTDEGYERVIHDQPRNKKKGCPTMPLDVLSTMIRILALTTSNLFHVLHKSMR
ncbi:hypothetical protein [Photobacterium leiognathi]|uniref:hypothetical protein n=1 Tax=Photobacterium leiognathi TaxID=553611 RepID=UPI002736548C|nr:hypothetical protein [Photobacterium leiognathi]